MTFLEWLSSMAIVIGMSALPVIELKGAIPYGLASGLPLWGTFFAALLGSCLPAPFVLLLAKRVFAWMHRSGIKILARFADYLEKRSIGRGAKVIASPYTYWALFVFVAIPLPTTGVWTGAIISALLSLDFKRALPAIILGNVVAGFIILVLSYGIFG